MKPTKILLAAFALSTLMASSALAAPGARDHRGPAARDHRAPAAQGTVRDHRVPIAPINERIQVRPIRYSPVVTDIDTTMGARGPLVAIEGRNLPLRATIMLGRTRITPVSVSSTKIVFALPATRAAMQHLVVLAPSGRLDLGTFNLVAARAEARADARAKRTKRPRIRTNANASLRFSWSWSS